MHSDWPRGVFARECVNIVGVSVKRGPDTWSLRMLISYGGWQNDERKMRMAKRSVMKIANRNKGIKNKKVEFLVCRTKASNRRRTTHWKAAGENLSFVYSQERMS